MLAADARHEPRSQTRPVYLPAGRVWSDFWTGLETAGGKVIRADAPIERIPLLVPSGSIIPLGPPVQYAAEDPGGPIELRVYPGSDASFTFYEDENDSYDYEKGVYSTTRFEWSESLHQLTIGERRGAYPGMPATRVFRVVIVAEGHGVGPDVTEEADRVVTYAGQAQTLRF